MTLQRSLSLKTPCESEKNSLPEPTVQDEAVPNVQEHCKGDWVVTNAAEATVLVEEIHPRDMKPWQWILLSGSVFFATTLLALDNTVVADLQPQIVEAFGEYSKFPWINLNYSLGAVVSGLLWYVILCFSLYEKDLCDWLRELCLRGSPKLQNDICSICKVTALSKALR